MKEEDYTILSTIANKCCKNPEFLTHVITAGVSGVVKAEKEMRQMAADMETMASAMAFLVGEKRVSPQFKKQMSELALSKMQKYYGKSFLNWKNQIEEKCKVNPVLSRVCEKGTRSCGVYHGE